MGKPTICIGKNKDADKDKSASLFSLLNSSSTSIQNFKLLAIFCDCTGQFVSAQILIISQ